MVEKNIEKSLLIWIIPILYVLLKKKRFFSLLEEK